MYIYIYIYKDLLDACIAYRLLLKKKIEEKNSIWTKISYYYYYRELFLVNKAKQTSIFCSQSPITLKSITYKTSTLILN